MTTTSQNSYMKNKTPAIESSLVIFVLTGAIVFPLCLSFLPHLVGIIGFSLMAIRKKQITIPIKPIFIAIGIICGVVLLSILWSYKPDSSISRGLKICANLVLFLPFLFFLKNISQDSIDKLAKIILIPFLCVSVFFCFELSFNLPILNLFFEDNLETWVLNKQIAALLLLSPLVIFLQNNKKSPLCFIFYIALFGIFLNTASQSVQLATLVMLGCFAAYKAIPKITAILCFISASIAVVVMPFISTTAYSYLASKIGEDGILRRASAAQRLEIWDFISQKVMEHPLIGMGLDATRYIDFNGHQAYYKSDTVLHPHNISLQIWLELGAIGVICTLAIFYMIYKSVKTINPIQRLYCLIVFSGAFTLLMTSWSIWASWLIGLMLLSLALTQIKFQNHP